MCGRIAADGIPMTPVQSRYNSAVVEVLLTESFLLRNFKVSIVYSGVLAF